MKLIKQLNKWSCLPTSFSMVMEIPIETLLIEIGHDGSEVLFPQLPEPKCRRSFEIHEIIRAGLNLGYYVTPIVRTYTAGPEEKEETFHLEYSVSEEYLFEIMSRFSGVLTGFTLSGLRHAVAWDRHMILDPNGWKYDRNRFIMEVFWAVGRLP